MKLLVLLMVFANVAFAEGISYLGLCHKTFNCDRVKQSFWGHRRIVTGWLEQSFGEECRCADELLKSRKEKVIRIHIANGPCLRNRRCAKNEIFFGYTIRQAERAVKNGRGRWVRRFDRVLQRSKTRLEQARGRLKCYVSPVLESDFDDKARKVLLDRTGLYFPQCRLVDNPLKKPCLPGYICERHGKDPNLTRPCIADLDGEDGAQVNLREFRNNVRQCEVRYYWEPWMNCLRAGKFVTPLERDCEFMRKRFLDAGRKSCRL